MSFVGKNLVPLPHQIVTPHWYFSPYIEPPRFRFEPLASTTHKVTQHLPNCISTTISPSFTLFVFTPSTLNENVVADSFDLEKLLILKISLISSSFWHKSLIWSRWPSNSLLAHQFNSFILRKAPSSMIPTNVHHARCPLQRLEQRIQYMFDQACLPGAWHTTDTRKCMNWKFYWNVLKIMQPNLFQLNKINGLSSSTSKLDLILAGQIVCS